MRQPTMVSPAIILLTAVWLSAAENEVPIDGKSNLVFASVEKGRELLGSRDEYTAEMGRFDLESRLMTRDDATVESLLDHVKAQVLPWSEDERASITRALASIRPRMKGLSEDLFPETVWLIKTTGKDEGGAAYCRGNAVILPQNMLARPPGGTLDRLLAHELFHILSRQDNERRRALYAIVGFTLVDPIDLPDSLADRKITNPDAPWINCYIKLQHEGKPFYGAPLLYASVERYDPTQGGTFFAYMKFDLLGIEKTADGWSVALNNGEPTLLDPKGQEDFFQQIGKNTRYIIHPEEIMADNFAALMTNQKNLPNPEILEKLRETLQADEAP